MYAIVETGSKQYKVSKGDLISVEMLGKKPGQAVKLDSALLVSDGKKVQIGTPYLKNVSINCEVVGILKTKKLVSFKYRRRKASKVKIGHRQNLTRLKVKEIKIT